MDNRAIKAVERIARQGVVEAHRAPGGYTSNSNWIVRLNDGSTVFAKLATDEQTTRWLQSERRIYANIKGSFLPRFIGYADEVPLLLLEDLSSATWPPPWSPSLINTVSQTLDELHAVRPPDGLPTPDEIDDLRNGWSTVAADPDPFLALHLCTADWINDALPTLLHASERAQLNGPALLHMDLRSDNLCIRDGTCLLIDWNHAARGNPLLDTVLWLPSLHLEGGPPPDDLTTPETADLAAVFAGYLACRAGLPEPPGPRPPGVRALQLAQLQVALEWTQRTLGLLPLDSPQQAESSDGQRSP